MSVRVPLASLIYPARCVEQAMAAFAGSASIRVEEQTTAGCVVEIAPLTESAEDARRTAGEFLNHLLDLSVEAFLSRSSPH